MLASWGSWRWARPRWSRSSPASPCSTWASRALHISNQSAIYALRPEARSRLTTAYMVAYFLGGAALSAVSSALYGADGWGGICVLGAATALLALVGWVVTEAAARRRAGPGPGGRMIDG